MTGWVEQSPGLFIDTAGFLELVDAAQPHHRAALACYREAKRTTRRLVTTNYVITEIIAMAHHLHLSRDRVVRSVADFLALPLTTLIHIDPILHQQAWDLLEARPDKSWSLVDCASFVVMEQRGITEALTSDHHFEQAGFTPLLPV